MVSSVSSPIGRSCGSGWALALRTSVVVSALCLGAGPLSAQVAGFKKTPIDATAATALKSGLSVANGTAGTNIKIEGSPGSYYVSGTVLGHPFPNTPLFSHSGASQGGSAMLGWSDWMVVNGQLTNTWISFLAGELATGTPAKLAADLLHECLHIGFAAAYPDFATDHDCTTSDPANPDIHGGYMEQLVSCTMASVLCAAAQNCSLSSKQREDLASEAKDENKECKGHEAADSCGSSHCSKPHPAPPSSMPADCTAAACN